MFCLKCGKAMINAGFCPFCQSSNSEKAENNYLKSDEMLALYKDDPDYKMVFNENTPKISAPESKLVFSGEKHQVQPEIKKNAPAKSSELPSGTEPAPQPSAVRPENNMPRRTENLSSDRERQYAEYSGNTDRQSSSGKRKKFSFMPIFLLLLLVIVIGIIILFVGKISGKPDHNRDDDDDRSNSVVENETRPEDETEPDTTDAGLIEENTAQATDIAIETNTEPATSEVIETTTEAVQSDHQTEWENRSVNLEKSIQEKIAPLAEYDSSNVQEIYSKCASLTPLNENFGYDLSFLDQTTENDNLEHFNNVIDGNEQYSDKDSNGTNRVCKEFLNYNMFYFKCKHTGDFTTQYLITEGMPQENSNIGVMCIYRSSQDSSFAYMAYSNSSDTKFFVIDVYNCKVYDMDSVLGQFNSQEQTLTQTDNNYIHGEG